MREIWHPRAYLHGVPHGGFGAEFNCAAKIQGGSHGNFEQEIEFQVGAFPDIPRGVGGGSAPLPWKLHGRAADPMEIPRGPSEKYCVRNTLAARGFLRSPCATMTIGNSQEPPCDVAESVELALCVHRRSERFY